MRYSSWQREGYPAVSTCYPHNNHAYLEVRHCPSSIGCVSGAGSVSEIKSAKLDAINLTAGRFCSPKVYAPKTRGGITLTDIYAANPPT